MLRPFLHPQRSVLPGPVQSLLHALEPLPGARILTKSASRCSSLLREREADLHAEERLSPML